MPKTSGCPSHGAKRFAGDSEAAQLLCSQQIGELERTIHAQHRASDRADGSRPSRVSACSVLPRSRQPSPTHTPSSRDASAQLGSDSFRGRIPLAARSGSAASRNRVIATCADCWSSGRRRSSDSARTHPDKHPWVIEAVWPKPAKVVAVALANKMARIAWAILAKGETYRAPALAASGLNGLGNEGLEVTLTAHTRIARVMMT